MGKSIKGVVVLLCFFVSVIVTAENDFLTGKLVTYTSDGYEIPMASQNISIQHTTINADTDERGVFRLNLRAEQNKYANQLKPGRKITLKLKDPGWFILTPYEGKLYVPKILDDYEMTVRVVFNQSKVKLGAYNAVFSTNKPNSKRLHFAAQVVSTISELSAYTVMDRFKRVGYAPTVKVIKEKNGKSTFKVFAGIYPNRVIAQNEVKKIKNRFPKHKDAFIKLILK